MKRPSRRNHEPAWISVLFTSIILVVAIISIICTPVNAPSREEEEVTLQATTPPETSPLETTDSPEESTDPAVQEVKPYIDLTYEEVQLLATVVYLEARGESYECQKAVASVVLNRMTTQGKSLSEVIYAKDQFSVVGQIPYASPSASTWRAAEEVVMNGPSVPTCVTFFRSGHYHRWDYARVAPYEQMDRTYFSHDTSLCHEPGGCKYEQ